MLYTGIEDTIIGTALPFPDLHIEGEAQPIQLNKNDTSCAFHERGPDDNVVDGAAREDPPFSASTNEKKFPEITKRSKKYVFGRVRMYDKTI